MPDLYRISEAQAQFYIARLQRQVRAFYLFSGPNGDPAFERRLEDRDRITLVANADASYRDRRSAELDAVHEFVHGGKMRLARWWALHHEEISLRDFSSVVMRLIQACFRVLKSDDPRRSPSPSDRSSDRRGVN